jgi:hypothetical protein
LSTLSNWSPKDFSSFSSDLSKIFRLLERKILSVYIHSRETDLAALKWGGESILAAAYCSRESNLAALESAVSYDSTPHFAGEKGLIFPCILQRGGFKPLYSNM